MRYIYVILIYSILAMGWFILPNCGGNGGWDNVPIDNTPIDNVPIDNTPIDNAPHIIEFTQPSTYADGSSMNVPSAIGGYYLYICHVINGQIIDNMVWIAEINTNTNPLNYDGAWKGRWDILNLITDNGILSGTRPDDTHAFALRAVSTIPINGKPDLSPFSTPWVYGNNPYQLDNTQIPQEGDPLAPHSNRPVYMLFDLGFGNK